jgi:hypothetical protein
MKLVQDEAPRYFEALRLSTRLVIAGWPAALVAALLGVTLAALAPGVGVASVGVALAALGAVAIAGLVRCRSFETVVGPRLLTVGTGPFRRRIPVGMIATAEARAAGSWRRLYADRELALTLSADQSPIIVPTADPDELEMALREGR